MDDEFPPPRLEQAIFNYHGENILPHVNIVSIRDDYVCTPNQCHLDRRYLSNNLDRRNYSREELCVDNDPVLSWLTGA